MNEKKKPECVHAITGCVNCNRECGPSNDWKLYVKEGNSCASREFAGDDELYDYIASQHH